MDAETDGFRGDVLVAMGADKTENLHEKSHLIKFKTTAKNVQIKKVVLRGRD